SRRRHTRWPRDWSSDVCSSDLAAPGAESVLGIFQAMMFVGVQLNLLLLAFNLIPIPPLDGSHVIKHLMPAKWAYYFQRFGRYGQIGRASCRERVVSSVGIVTVE